MTTESSSQQEVNEINRCITSLLTMDNRLRVKRLCDAERAGYNAGLKASSAIRYRMWIMSFEGWPNSGNPRRHTYARLS